MNIKYTNQEVSKLVSSELIRRRWTVRQCCETFNQENLASIRNGTIVPLDKDFVQRVKSGKFKVLSARIIRFCSFLGLDLSRNHLETEGFLKEEIKSFEDVILKKPHLADSVKVLLRSLLVVVQGESNEIY